MTKRNYKALLTVAVAIVVVAGGLWASNMGFKLNYPLKGTNTTPGLNTISLPYNRQAGIDNAKELVDDIGGFTGDGGVVGSIQRLVVSANTYQSYSGAPGQPVFDLNAGEGYFIAMGPNDVDYVIVGSHAPGLTINLIGQGDAGCTGGCVGLNLYGYPYHSTSSDAEELAGELGGFTGDGGPVNNVQRLVVSANTYQSYAGAPGQPVFELKPGEAYFVSLATGVPYVPSHF